MEVVYKTAETNEEIRNWVVLNGGKPAMIDDPMVDQDKIGLRIDWPGAKDESMLSDTRETTRDISWEEFFRIMEDQKLVFMYSEEQDINATWRYKFAKKDGFEPVEAE